MVILADILHIVVVIRGVVFFYILPLGPSVFALSILLRATFCKIPRIGLQEGKIEIPQTLSQQSPLETILENTRLSSFDFIFSK